jgi:hypothetical protein
MSNSEIANTEAATNNTKLTTENIQMATATQTNTNNSPEQNVSANETQEKCINPNALAELRKQEDIRIAKEKATNNEPLFFDFGDSLAPSKKLSLSLCNVEQLRSRIVATPKHCANGTTTFSVTLGSSVPLMIDGKKSFKAPTGHFSEPQEVVDFILSNMDSDKLDELLLAAQNAHILKLNRNKSVKGKGIAKARKEAASLKLKQKYNAKLSSLLSDTELLSAEAAHFKAELEKSAVVGDEKPKMKAA